MTDPALNGFRDAALRAAWQTQARENARLRQQNAAMRAALEQALDCIVNEVPEECTPEEAREATKLKIKAALALPAPAADAEAAEIERLRRISAIIEAVDQRCMAVGGPGVCTLMEMTQAEISEIYRLARGEAGGGRE